MKSKYSKILKSILIGSILFLIINKIDRIFFYEYHGIVRSYLIGFFFYPLLVIADIINLVIPISDSLTYHVLENPTYFKFSELSFSTNIFTKTWTLFIGIVWTSYLVYLYYSLKILKKFSKPLRITIFIIGVLLLLFIASIISGSPYARLCPLCA